MVLLHEEIVNIKMKQNDFFIRFFEDVTSFKTLIKKIKKESKRFQEFTYPDEYKMQGNLFEIFGEIFFKISEGDNRLGMFKYAPLESNEDYGVDGTGIGFDENPVAVQIKFRGNSTHEILGKELKQFVSNALIFHGVKAEKTSKNLIVFTSGKGMHWSSEKQFGKIRSIGSKELSLRLDNNLGFWNLVKEYFNV